MRLRESRVVGLVLAVATLALCVGLGEAFFRVIGFDFSRARQAQAQLPVFFQQPRQPVGDAFFRRAGPTSWRGNVLATRLDQLDIEPNPYRDAPAITVRYDANGFRNPPGLTSWPVAIAGDSMVEAGFLPQDELLTAVVARALGRPVANLGVSFSGPWSALAYLEAFGLSPETTQVVVMFFEGNDLRDLEREHRARIRWQRSGHRPDRAFRSQPSMLVAGRRLVQRHWRAWRSRRADGFTTARFRGSEGEVPITFFYTPPGRDDLAPRTVQQLRLVLGAYATFAEQHDVEPWIAYVPSKIRVLHGTVTFSDRAEARFAAWRPTDLPTVLAEMSAEAKLAFVDLTPPLVEAGQRTGQLLYNSVYDTHLNAAGYEVAGRALARALEARTGTGPPDESATTPAAAAAKTRAPMFPGPGTVSKDPVSGGSASRPPVPRAPVSR